MIEAQPTLRYATRNGTNATSLLREMHVMTSPPGGGAAGRFSHRCYFQPIFHSINSIIKLINAPNMHPLINDYFSWTCIFEIMTKKNGLKITGVSL